MKMKTLFFLFVAVLLTTACTQNSASYVIEGTLVDSTFNGKTVYLRDVENNANLDSVIVADSKFTLKGKTDSAVFCRIGVDRSCRSFFSSLILENGKFTYSMAESTSTMVKSTTPLNSQYCQMQEQQDSLSKATDQALSKMAKEVDSTQLDQTQNDYISNVYMPAIKSISLNVFEANTDNVLGKMALRPIINILSEEELNAALAKAGPTVMQDTYIQKQLQQVEAKRKTAEGMPFVDFTIETEPGTKVSLSDYVGKGKYVLVDFWASWCGPCRQETPVIKEVYEKYKDKGFEVLGVAGWDKPEDTKKAIEELGITWPQIINAQQIATDLYGVNGIPHIILFDPDGKIVARNLRGEGLKSKVAEVMEK